MFKAGEKQYEELRRLVVDALVFLDDTDVEARGQAYAEAGTPIQALKQYLRHECPLRPKD